MSLRPITHRRSGMLAVAAALVVALGVEPGVASADDEEVPGDVAVMAVGSRSNSGAPKVKIFIDADSDGQFEPASSFSPYTTKLDDGVRVATGDFDGDKNDELVTATDKGTKVIVWEMNSNGVVGAPLCSYPGFPEGAFIAAGDLDGDGMDELAIARDEGGAPTVVLRGVSNGSACPDTVTSTFSAYGESKTGGVRVAFGDTTNNALHDELITAPGPGGGSQIRVWTDADNDRVVNDGPRVETFDAFGASFNGGVYVASGPIQNAGTGGAEILASKGSGASSVKIFSDSNANTLVSDDPLFDTLKPYGSVPARVAAADSDGSGLFVEALLAPGASAGTQKVKIADDTIDAGSLLSDNPYADAFTAFPSTWAGGAHIALAAVRGGNYSMPGMPVSIPDGNTVTSRITVPSTAGRVKDLDVSLNIAHTFDGDLDVSLKHVTTGHSIVLFDDVGGSAAGFQIRLNDETGVDIGTATNPSNESITGTFQPEGAAALSDFEGDDASGAWELTITDDNAGDSGALMGWTLHFTY